VHNVAFREAVRARVESGQSQTDVSRELGLPLSTVSRWVNRRTPTDALPPPVCWRCSGRTEATDPAAYSYLLGQYLGDGHLVVAARVPVLRIYACTDYPRDAQ
jgi:hypothetical protein